MESISLLHTWCREAVDEFGDDWALIKQYVNKKLLELPEAERERFSQQIKLLLAPLSKLQPH